MTDLRHHTPTAPPIGAALRAFRTPIRGHAFAARPDGLPAPYPGQAVQLRREPENPADPQAIAVWTVPSPAAADADADARAGVDGPAGPAATERSGAGWRIGYLDRTVAARLAPRLDAGLRVEARVDGWVAEPRGRWRRPIVLLRPGTADLPAPLAPTTTPAAGPRRRATTGPGLWGRPPGVRVRPVR